MKTNESKHTPGPWHLSHQVGDGFSVAREIAPNCGRLIPLATAHTGQFWGEVLSDDIARANARLIAAAPELLEALEKARQAVAPAFNPSPEGDDGSTVVLCRTSLQFLFNELSGTIAKAKGEV